ncbi:hypothetical protein [Cognatilysobacter bugurensis]|nr:hypothetical protein [Lysobacter bugurensis]
MALFNALALVLLVAFVSGVLLISKRRKAGWPLAGAAAAMLFALGATVYGALRVPERTITVELGASWVGEKARCAEAALESMCFPAHGRYTARILLPDGQTRLVEGEQLFVRLGPNGRVKAVQLALSPHPTVQGLDGLLAQEQRRGRATHRGCGQAGGASTMTAYRKWLTEPKVGDCNLEIKQGSYSVGLHLQKSGSEAGRVFTWYTVYLADQQDGPANNSSKPKPLRGSA